MIGSLEDLDAAKLDDVKEWFKTYYGPNNAVLVDRRRRQHAGDPGEGQDVLRRHPARPPVARFDQWVAKRTGTLAPVRAGPRSADAHHARSWNVPGDATRDRVLLDSRRRRCSHPAKSSRLYKRLVYDDQIATRVAAYIDTREIASLFTIEADVKKDGRSREGRASDGRRAGEALGERPDAGRAGPREDRRRSPGFIRGVERIGGFGGKSDVLAASMVYGGRPDAYKDELEIIRRRDAGAGQGRRAEVAERRRLRARRSIRIRPS